MYLLIYLYLAQAGAIVSIPTAYTPHKQEPLFKAAGLDDSKAFYDAQQAIVSIAVVHAGKAFYDYMIPSVICPGCGCGCNAMPLTSHLIQATAVLDAYVAANGLLLGENGGGSKN